MDTLDETGRLDGMPFMPEMAAYCGRRARVSKRAHKTCDAKGNQRWLDDAVHLEGWRCDGSAHSGCQLRCLQFWKTAWLRLVDDDGLSVDSSPSDGDTSDLLAQLGPVSMTDDDGIVRYTCQATEVVAATKPLPPSDVKQYIWDVTSGNWSLWKIARVLLRSLANRYQVWSKRHLPSALLIHGGRGTEPVGGQLTSRTPRRLLDLQVGETARVRPLPEIERTLDTNNCNRGLLFDREMATWCGTNGTVLDRVERIIDEHTGELIEIGSDCIVLENKTCRGEYFRLCSRGIYSFWRETWLEREDAFPGEQ